MGRDGARLAFSLLPHDGPIEVQHVGNLAQALHDRVVNRVRLDGDQSLGDVGDQPLGSQLTVRSGDETRCQAWASATSWGVCSTSKRTTAPT